jgi:hypothetical protein
MAPIFRRMAAHPGFDLHVAYCSLRGAEAAHDPEFGATIQWDVPLLEGYSWSHIPNHGSGAETFLGLRNPGLSKLIRDGNYDAVLCFVGYDAPRFGSSGALPSLPRRLFCSAQTRTRRSPRWPNVEENSEENSLAAAISSGRSGNSVPSSGARDLMVSLGLPADRVTLTPYSVDNDWWMKQSAP